MGTKTAVPYYGRIYRSRLGYERVFFIVGNDDSVEKNREVRIGVWDVKMEPSLHVWLKNNGVGRLVCKEDLGRQMQQKMKHMGITVLNENCPDARLLMKSLLV